MKKRLILTLFAVLIIPCTALAGNLNNLNFANQTGLEFYTIIKPLGDLTKFSDPKKEVENALTIGYLTGFIQSLVTAQQLIVEVDTPVEELSQAASGTSEEIHLRRINFPEDGIAPFQLILIYNKWAEDNPGHLSHSSGDCLLASIIEEYGWK